MGIFGPVLSVIGDEDLDEAVAIANDAGHRPGDHIAFMLENRWEFLAISWAAQRSGLYYTPVSSRLQADELAYIVDDCGAKVFIASAAVADIAMKVSAAI